jgi:hypothetical protein
MRRDPDLLYCTGRGVPACADCLRLVFAGSRLPLLERADANLAGCAQQWPHAEADYPGFGTHLEDSSWNG